jgi:hypothetical protein
MGADGKTLPLVFHGHSASMYAAQEREGGWRVATEVDGRLIGWEHCPTWRLVEQLRNRMQRWLSQAEHAERRRYAA